MWIYVIDLKVIGFQKMHRAMFGFCLNYTSVLISHFNQPLAFHFHLYETDIFHIPYFENLPEKDYTFSAKFINYRYKVSKISYQQLSINVCM